MSNLKEKIKQRDELFNKISDELHRIKELDKIECEISRLYEPIKKDIGNIENYYGNLSVAEEDGAYFWAIEDYLDTFFAEEIPKELYDALIKFNTKKE